jgi:hypothetical protein
VECDVVFGLRSAPSAPGHDEDADVTGFIIIVGGAPWSRPTIANPAVFSFGARTLYSTPQIGAIYLGVSPDG